MCPPRGLVYTRFSIGGCHGSEPRPDPGLRAVQEREDWRLAEYEVQHQHWKEIAERYPNKVTGRREDITTSRDPSANVVCGEDSCL